MDRLAADLASLGIEGSLTNFKSPFESDIRNKGILSSPSYAFSVNSLAKKQCEGSEFCTIKTVSLKSKKFSPSQLKIFL